MASPVRFAVVVLMLGACSPRQASCPCTTARHAPRPAATASATPSPAPAGELAHVVPFEIGDTSLADGDSLTIEQVRGTLPTFEAQGRYSVRGTYTLASQPSATLLFSITATDQTGAEQQEVEPTARVTITQGSGAFLLSRDMRRAGWPHVSLYPASGGSSFGGVYFGQGATLKPKTASDVIPGWWLSGGGSSSYHLVRDQQVRRSGKWSARLEASSAGDSTQGSIGQEASADVYRGKRLRFTAHVRTENVAAWAGLWLRIEGGKRKSYYADMSERPIRGTTDWAPHDIVVDVDPNATRLYFGLFLAGNGRAWIDGVRLEVVPNSVPANDRPRAVLNGDFEARGEWPAGWSMSGSGRRAYEPSLDRTIRHGGGASAKLAPRTSPPRGYGTLVQGIDAAPWRGKRVSVTSFVRGNGVLARGDLWVRVQAHDSPADGPGLGGGTCKFSGSFDWQPCQVVFDVPAAGDEIQIGIGLDGGGVLWLDDVRMAAVGRNVALRSGNSDSLRNLDFEE